MIEPTPGFYYLASPYYHPKQEIMEQRYHIVAAMTTDLLKRGVHTYSPIVHNHHLAVNGDLPRDFDFWMDYDCAMLSKADAIIVAQIDGWQQSRGVAYEMEFARTNNIKLTFMEVPFRILNSVIPQRNIIP